MSEDEAPLLDLPKEILLAFDEVPSSPITEQVGLKLAHKPRGSGGLWKEINNFDTIRVTTGHGKKLKLYVTLNDGLMEQISPDRVAQAIQLVPANGVSFDKNAAATFEIEKVHVVPKNYFEVNINLKRGGSNIKFRFYLLHENNMELFGESVTFSTHLYGGTVSSELPATPANTDAPVKRPRLSSDDSPPLVSDNNQIVQVSGALEVSSYVRAQQFVQFSDARLKVNIHDITDAMDIVSKLKGRKYQWKSHPLLSAPQTKSGIVIGFIAQEVQEVIPEVVNQDPVTGLYSVSYIEILPILTEAFNQFVEVTRQQDILKTEQIKNLMARVQELQDRMDKEMSDEMALKRAVVVNEVSRHLVPHTVTEFTPMIGEGDIIKGEGEKVEKVFLVDEEDDEEEVEGQFISEPGTYTDYILFYFAGCMFPVMSLLFVCTRVKPMRQLGLLFGNFFDSFFWTYSLFVCYTGDYCNKHFPSWQLAVVSLVLCLAIICWIAERMYRIRMYMIPFQTAIKRSFIYGFLLGLFLLFFGAAIHGMIEKRSRQRAGALIGMFVGAFIVGFILQSVQGAAPFGRFMHEIIGNPAVFIGLFGLCLTIPHWFSLLIRKSYQPVVNLKPNNA